MTIIRSHAKLDHFIKPSECRWFYTCDSNFQIEIFIKITNYVAFSPVLHWAQNSQIVSNMLHVSQTSAYALTHMTGSPATRAAQTFRRRDCIIDVVWTLALIIVRFVNLFYRRRFQHDDDIIDSTVLSLSCNT